MSGVQALVLGRNTYDTVRGFGGEWPYKGKRVVVATHRPLPTPLADEVAMSGSVASILDHLGSLGVKRAYVDGGTLIRQALAEQLITELTLSIVPVLLGEGRPLFGGPTASDWKPLAAKTFPSGLVQITYRR